MEEAKHTKGEWNYDQDGQVVYVGKEEDGRWIAQVRGWGWIQYIDKPEEIQDANGRLISAAPDQHEALIATQELLERLGLESSGEYSRNAAAIAKALGK